VPRPVAALARHRIALAETYPGLAYAAAVAPDLPSPRLAVAKTRRLDREAFCEQLARASWVREGSVSVQGLGLAVNDEDVFDSLVTAAAVLRCFIESRLLCDTNWIHDDAEGGIQRTLNTKLRYMGFDQRLFDPKRRLRDGVVGSR
jgi:hypothetical protein